MIFSITLVTAQSEIQTLGTFRVTTTIELTQIAANTTSCNITSVSIPQNRTTLITDQEMITINSIEYSYTLQAGNTTQVGEYIVNGICDEDGLNVVWAYNCFITKTGTTLSNAES